MKKTVLILLCSIAVIFCFSTATLANTDTSVEDIEIICDGMVYYVEQGETVSIPLYVTSTQATSQNFSMGTVNITYVAMNNIKVSIDLLSKYEGRIFWGDLRINDNAGNLVADWDTKSNNFKTTSTTSTSSLTWDPSHELSSGNRYTAYYYNGSVLVEERTNGIPFTNYVPSISISFTA